MVDGVHRLADLDGDAGDLEVAVCHLRHAEEHLGGLRAAGAEQAGKAEQLALLLVEGDVLHLAGHADVIGLKHHLRVRLLRGALEVEDLVQVLADHAGNELQLGDFVCIVHADEMAVAQHGQAVAHLKHLIQEVRDEDDAHALGLQIAHDVEQALDLLVVQGRGRLVEDQHLRIHVHGAGDGNHLLNGGGILGERARNVDVNLEALKQLLGAPVDFLPVDLAAADGLAADEDVLGDGQVVAQVNLLENGRNAKVHGILGIGGADLLAFKCDRTGVHLVDAGQALDQRGFARAVFAQQRVHLAAPEREIHAVERLDARELDFNAFHGQDHVSIQCSSSLRNH